MIVWEDELVTEERMYHSLRELCDSILNFYKYEGVLKDTMLEAACGDKEAIDLVVENTTFIYRGINCKILPLNDKVYFLPETDDLFKTLYV